MGKNKVHKIKTGEEQILFYQSENASDIGNLGEYENESLDPQSEVQYIGLGKSSAKNWEQAASKINDIRMTEDLLARSREFKSQFQGMIGMMQIDQADNYDPEADFTEQINETDIQEADPDLAELVSIEEVEESLEKKQNMGFSNSTVIPQKDDLLREERGETKRKNPPIAQKNIQSEIEQPIVAKIIQASHQEHSKMNLDEKPNSQKRVLITVIKKPTTVKIIPNKE